MAKCAVCGKDIEKGKEVKKDFLEENIIIRNVLKNK
jgi:hypothetical protein